MYSVHKAAISDNIATRTARAYDRKKKPTMSSILRSLSGSGELVVCWGTWCVK